MRRIATTVLIASLATPALATPRAELVEGDSALDACLGDEACHDRVSTLLGETMTEYGLLLQSEPLGTDALAGRGWGPTFSLHLDTAVLGPRNEIERAAPVIPGIPRLGVGWLIGPTSVRPDRAQLAVGTTFLPPVRYDGGLLSSAQVDVSLATPVVGRWLWLGGGAGFGAARVELPLFGDDSQLDAIESETGFAVKRNDTCTEDPCRDVYAQRVGTLRFGVTIEPVPALFAYARGTVATVSSRFEADYDDTVWRLDHLQLQGHAGAGVRAGGYQIAGGLTAVPRPETLSTDGSRSMVQVMLTTTWRLGPTYERRPEPRKTRQPLPPGT